MVALNCEIASHPATEATEARQEEGHFNLRRSASKAFLPDRFRFCFSKMASNSDQAKYVDMRGVFEAVEFFEVIIGHVLTVIYSFF